MQYFLQSEIPANTPNWLWYFHSGLSTDLLLRFSWLILCPMPMMPMRAHMPTRVFRIFSRVRGSGSVRVLVSPIQSPVNRNSSCFQFEGPQEFVLKGIHSTWKHLQVIIPLVSLIYTYLLPIQHKHWTNISPHTVPTPPYSKTRVRAFFHVRNYTLHVAR